MQKRIYTLALAALGLVAASVPGQAAPADLFGAINERLGYMQAVAAWKLDNQRPVEDLKREQVVLDAARGQAAEIGLSKDSVTGFFQAQIEAAKDIQTCWIGRWNDGAARPTDVPDLIEEVRPALLSLGKDILTLMAAETVTEEDRQAFSEAITVDCLPDDAREALFEGLLAVRTP